MREMAASSCAAETNQASYGDGGRYTPASSIAWKKAAYAGDDTRLASVKFVTGSVLPRNTENRFPATDMTYGTPAAASASPVTLRSDSANESIVAYTAGVHSRSVA